MKKFLCTFLSVVMVLSLCLALVGCGPEDVRGDVVNNATENKTPSENKTPTGTTAPAETEPDFSMGKATGSTYHNDFLGLSCTVPEGWEFLTDEQIKELNNIAGDYMDEKVAEQLKNAAIIYDMQAQNLTEGASIGVNLEKLTAVQLITLNIKQVLEAQLPTIKDTYAQIGYTDVNAAYQKITVDGKEFDGIKLTAKIQGLDFVMVVFAFRKGNYLVNVSAGTLNTAQMDTILGYFDVK